MLQNRVLEVLQTMYGVTSPSAAGSRGSSRAFVAVARGPLSQIKMVTTWPREVHHPEPCKHCNRQEVSWSVARCLLCSVRCNPTSTTSHSLCCQRRVADWPWLVNFVRPGSFQSAVGPLAIRGSSLDGARQCDRKGAETADLSDSLIHMHRLQTIVERG